MIGLDLPGYQHFGCEPDESPQTAIDELQAGNVGPNGFIEYLVNCHPEAAYTMLDDFIHKYSNADKIKLERIAIDDMDEWATKHPEEIY